MRSPSLRYCSRLNYLSDPLIAERLARLVTFPPAAVLAEGRRASASLDRAAVLAEMDEKLPGFLAYLEPDNPEMHTTDTINFEVVFMYVYRRPSPSDAGI
jgi:hypothetical protein